MRCAPPRALLACVNRHHCKHIFIIFGDDLGEGIASHHWGKDTTCAISAYTPLFAVPVGNCQVYIVLCSTCAPQDEVKRIVFVGTNDHGMLNGSRSQPNRVWEIKQRGGAHEVHPFSCQYTERF